MKNTRASNNGKILTSLLLTVEQRDACIQHHLRYIDVFRIGLGIKLAELGVEEYDSNLNLSRKLAKIIQILEEKSQELEKMKEKYEKN